MRFPLKKLLLTSILFAGVLSAFPSYAAPTVSGLAGCIMKTGGQAGWRGADQQVWATIREPASGDYADPKQPWIFSQGHTFWISPGGFDVYHGGTHQKGTTANFVQWGSIAYTMRPSDFKNPFTGGPKKVGAKVAESLGWAGNDAKVNAVGVDGWTYKRGAYRGYYTGLKVAYYDNLYGDVYFGDVYGVYREREGYISVPGNTVFETCSSASNASNGNWVFGSFAQAKDINVAFSSFETSMISKINEKKLNLSLVSETLRVTESVTAGKTISVSSTGYKGTAASNGVRAIGNVSEDATTMGNSFKKY